VKLCFVNSNLFWGGAEKWHVRAATFLSGQGHEIIFIARTEEVAAPVRQMGLTARLLPFKSDVDPYTFFSLYLIFRRFKPDAVVFNSDRDLRLGGLAALAAGIKTRVHRKGITGLKNTARYKWIHRNLRTHTLCASEAVLREIESLGWVDKESLRVIYSGVDVEEFQPEGSRNLRMELKIGDDEVLIGTLSRLSSIKGLEYLLKAVPLIRGQSKTTRFALVGTGRIEEELKSLAKNMGIADVTAFPGFRPAADALRSFDIVVLPSVSTEGFPNSVIEAMSCGRAVVASRLAGIPEAVIDGETGLVVPPRDETALGEAILRLVTDFSLRRRMGESARERAKRHFDYRTKFEELEKWLTEIIS